MELPKNEAIIDFNETGETTDKNYLGRFTVLCILNMGKKHQLELEKTRLQADFVNPTDGLAGIAIVLANLRTKILDAPEWWKQSNGGADIEDEDVLLKLYDKLREKEVEWKESIKKKATEKAIEGNPQGNVSVESK